MRTPDELARDLWRYTKDASGHEHAPAGSPEGGQFTGKAEHGQSPDDMAAKIGQKAAQPASQEAKATTNMIGHLASLVRMNGDDYTLPESHLKSLLTASGAGVSGNSFHNVFGQLLADDWLMEDYDEDVAPEEGEETQYKVGPTSVLLSALTKHQAEDGEPIDPEQMKYFISDSYLGLKDEEQAYYESEFANHGQGMIDTLTKAGLLSKDADGNYIVHNPNVDDWKEEE